jgi:hypothetical protein
VRESQTVAFPQQSMARSKTGSNARKIPREARKNRLFCEVLDRSRTLPQIGKKARIVLELLGFGASRQGFAIPLHKPRVGGSIPPAATSEKRNTHSPKTINILFTSPTPA